MNAQSTSLQLTERIYRDMLYKAAFGEKFPVDTGAAFGTWVNRPADIRLTHRHIEAFNGYQWMPISILTLRVWQKRARKQRQARNVRPTHS